MILLCALQCLDVFRLLAGAVSSAAARRKKAAIPKAETWPHTALPPITILSLQPLFSLLVLALFPALPSRLYIFTSNCSCVCGFFFLLLVFVFIMLFSFFWEENLLTHLFLWSACGWSNIWNGVWQKYCFCLQCQTAHGWPCKSLEKAWSSRLYYNWDRDSHWLPRKTNQIFSQQNNYVPTKGYKVTLLCFFHPGAVGVSTAARNGQSQSDKNDWLPLASLRIQCH